MTITRHRHADRSASPARAPLRLPCVCDGFTPCLLHWSRLPSQGKQKLAYELGFRLRTREDNT